VPDDYLMGSHLMRLAGNRLPDKCISDNVKPAQLTLL
jgi:hypothetical protein